MLFQALINIIYSRGPMVTLLCRCPDFNYDGCMVVLTSNLDVSAGNVLL
jgi:hypothetical protein